MFCYKENVSFFTSEFDVYTTLNINFLVMYFLQIVSQQHSYSEYL